MAKKRKTKAVGKYINGSIYWIYPSVKEAAKDNRLAVVTARNVIYGYFKLKSGIDFQYLDDKGARWPQDRINDWKMRHSLSQKKTYQKKQK